MEYSQMHKKNSKNCGEDFLLEMIPIYKALSTKYMQHADLIKMFSIWINCKWVYSAERKLEFIKNLAIGINGSSEAILQDYKFARHIVLCCTAQEAGVSYLIGREYV